MGIINSTPDSFFKGSRASLRPGIIDILHQFVKEGVDIIDVGGYSSRPGAKEVPEDIECVRVMMVLEAIKSTYPDMVVSVDTFRSSVVKEVYKHFGPIIVNDISAGTLDECMVPFVAEKKLPFAIMHMRGMPSNMQTQTNYENVVSEVLLYLQKRVVELRAAGVEDIIVDPGFGFSKTTEQNYQLLAALSDFKIIGVPVLAGLSRKSMVYNPLEINAATALNGTTAIHWAALEGGANILRVHDVEEAVQTIKLFELYDAARANKN